MPKGVRVRVPPRVQAYVKVMQWVDTCMTSKRYAADSYVDMRIRRKANSFVPLGRIVSLAAIVRAARGF